METDWPSVEGRSKKNQQIKHFLVAELMFLRYSTLGREYHNTEDFACFFLTYTSNKEWQGIWSPSFMGK